MCLGCCAALRDGLQLFLEKLNLKIKASSWGQPSEAVPGRDCQPATLKITFYGQRFRNWACRPAWRHRLVQLGQRREAVTVPIIKILFFWENPEAARANGRSPLPPSPPKHSIKRPPGPKPGHFAPALRCVRILECVSKMSPLRWFSVAISVSCVHAHSILTSLY